MRLRAHWIPHAARETIDLNASIGVCTRLLTSVHSASETDRWNMRLNVSESLIPFANGAMPASTSGADPAESRTARFVMQFG